MGRREKLGLGLFRWLSIILKNYSEKSCKKMLKTRQEARGGIQSMRVEAEWVGNLKEGYFRNMVDGSRAATMDTKVEIYSHLSW